MWTALTIGIVMVLAIVAVGIWACVPKAKRYGESPLFDCISVINMEKQHQKAIRQMSIGLPYDRELLNIWFAKYDEVMRIERLAELKQAMFRDLVAMKDRSGLAIMNEDQ